MDKIAQGNQAAALEQRTGQHRIAIMDHGTRAASDPEENLCELRVGDPATMQGQCQQCSVELQLSSQCKWGKVAQEAQRKR